jgi:hypothetical protein
MLVTIVAGTDPTEHIARMAMYVQITQVWVGCSSALQTHLLLQNYVTFTSERRVLYLQKLHDHTYSNVDTGF